MDKLWNDLPQGARDSSREEWICFLSKTAPAAAPAAGRRYERAGIVRQLSLMETDKEEASGSEIWEPNFAGTPRGNLDGMITSISTILRGGHRKWWFTFMG